MNNEDSATSNTTIHFWESGNKKEVDGVDPNTILVLYLQGLGFTGTRKDYE